MGMSRIFWDTNIFIYLFEDYGRFSQTAAELREKMLLRGDQLLTSTLTVGEILVKPMQAGDQELCEQYEMSISNAAIVLPFDLKAARVSASLRSDQTLRAPDIVQLSCASVGEADLFVTNDNRLQGKHIPGIQFIVPLDRVPI
jgi:predicted nucleic acid-binding protein